MQAREIQRIVLDETRREGVRVLKSTLYSISDQPDEPHQRSASSSGLIWVAIMTQTEYSAIRARCNERGVDFANVKWTPYGMTDLYTYSAFAVPTRGHRQ